MAKILDTNDALVKDTAANFRSYDVIRVSANDTTGSVSLELSGAGSLDLTKPLEGLRGATVYASDKGNTITGGALNDTLYGNAKADTLNGGDGNDTLYGALNVADTAADVLNGGKGDDSIYDYGGKVAIDGGEGQDHIYLGYDVKGGTVDGGADRDVLGWTGFSDLSGLTIKNVEVLETAGAGFVGTAAQFTSFDRIVVYDDGNHETSDITLTLKGTGSLDLTKALEGHRGATVFASDVGNTITGGVQADTLYGGAKADTLNGGDGDDTLYGALNVADTADDILNGGKGDDTIHDDGGKVAIDGGAGNDRILLGYDVKGGTVDGGADRDVLGWTGFSDLSGLAIKNVEVLETAGAGFVGTAAQFSAFDRIVVADSGAETQDVTLILKGAGSLDLTKQLEGRRGADVFASDVGNTVTGGIKADRLYGGAKADTLNGGDGNDTLYGAFNVADTADDILNGGKGDDVIHDDGGKAAVDGGAGGDRIYLGYDVAGGTVDGGADRDVLAWGGLADISALSITNVEVLETAGVNLTGTVAQFASFDRIVVADSGAETQDVTLTLKGAGSLDLTKALEGNRGATVFASDDGNTITGGAKADTFYGGAGSDTLNGGDGDDTLYGAFNKISTAGDVLNGGKGNDRLYAGAGDDTLNGGDGDDTIVDDGGKAAIDAGAGKDRIALGYDIAGGTVDGGADRDVLAWGGLADISGLTIKNVEVLETAGVNFTGTAAQFSAFDRIVVADSGTETQDVTLTLKGAGSLDLTKALEGKRGATVFTSAEGNTVTGGAKADAFYGGSGNDTFKGAGGNDRIDGGDGNDIAVYDGNFVGFTISGKQSDGSYLVKGSGIGTDTLTTVETLRFNDGTYDLATGKFTPATVYAAPKLVLSGTALGGNGGAVLTVDGQAAAAKTVELFDGATKVGSAVADANGRFTTTLPELKLPSGATTAELRITAIVSDGSGATSPASNALVVEIGTGAGLADKLSTYASTAGLAAILITDGSNLAFASKAALDQARADYAGTLAKVVGTYTLSVETTDAAGQHSDIYLADGTLRKTVLLGVDGTKTVEGFDANGAKISRIYYHDGLREDDFTVTGKPYARQHAVYDEATGKPVSVDRYDAKNNHVFSDNYKTDGSHAVTIWAANGDETVTSYDAKGRLTGQTLRDADDTLVRTIVQSADGSSETHRYDRVTGEETSSTVVNADKSRVESLVNVKNKPYVQQDSAYGSNGKLLSVDQTAADGSHVQTAKAAGQTLASHAGVADTFNAYRNGADAFSFDAGFGKDTVKGFQAGSGANHDVLKIDDAYASSFAEVQSKISKVGADTLISFSPDDTILLKNVAPGALTAENFQFAHGVLI